MTTRRKPRPQAKSLGVEFLDLIRPLERALPKKKKPTAKTRYFTHVDGFGDDTAYLSFTSNRASVVSKGGIESKSKYFKLRKALGHVQAGEWKEISRTEALNMLSAPLRKAPTAKKAGRVKPVWCFEYKHATGIAVSVFHTRYGAVHERDRLKNRFPHGPIFRAEIQCPVWEPKK